LLLVSYYFPPLAGPGVFRPLRLSKYLPRHGWDVTVLTVGARVRALKDASLLDEVGPGVSVERTFSLEPRNLFLALNRLGLSGLVERAEPWFMIPDDQRGWVPFAARCGTRILRDRRHDAMLTTAGPYSTHLVGLALRRRFEVPWVADFRDEWTTNPYLHDRYPTGWHRRLNRKLERRVLAAADRVTCVSRPWLEAIHGVADDLPSEKFRVMPNGFDGAHFPSAPTPRGERFRIVYTGTFYGHRSPGPFLEGLRRSVTAGSIPREDLEVVFMGHGTSAMREDPDLRGVLRAVGHRPYFEALELMQGAELLLLVVPPEGGAGNHTGKLFPYLATGRPILALAPADNVAAELVRSTRSGVVVAPDDPGAIAHALEQRHAAWQRGDLPFERDTEQIARYEADRQAADWANLLEDAGNAEGVKSWHGP
jgi:glycosyltransferase involved in cell wall biosynthesis